MGIITLSFFILLLTPKRKSFIILELKSRMAHCLITPTIFLLKPFCSFCTTCRDYSVLKKLWRVVDEEGNKMLIELPNMEEIKEFVFSMSSVSSPGPYGISGDLPNVFVVTMERMRTSTT
uniref:Uncharacterized protein n=1 Tax=Solanum lycopersicum TaxID=4081 RepID=A0A3Q7G5R1_SOLLC